ncbi:SLAC1 family transporter [Protaetiibacter intestinalis]|uniref:SLAC1 family transporter n=1 Tax=Protaetiibacter intestinalis TaxID=2419774 RepID=UPI001300554C|nr:transporter [Protaetiibacter intestinalis]
MAAERIPLNTLAIPFGLAGIADVWTFAGGALPIPTWLPPVLWTVVAVSWVWLVVAHVVRGFLVRMPLREQLRHPVQGPIAALVPVVAMLVGIEAVEYSPVVGRVVIGLAMITTALYAGWFFGRVFTGGIAVDAVHGGYLLPSVAGGYIASYAAAVSGWTGLAIGWFGFGTLGWVVTFSLLTARLALRPALPDALQPTLMIMIAPPAVGGLALFAIDPSIGAAQEFMAVTLIVMLLAQLALLPRYLKTTFTLGFWSFTFPCAAAASYGIVWVTTAEVPGYQIITLVLATAITSLVLVIALRSLKLVLPVPAGVIAAEDVLARDDDSSLRRGTAGLNAPSTEGTHHGRS